MLEISELHVRYGQAVHALRGVSLSVPERSIVAVLGANGAGKTTLLRTIAGTLSRHRGTVDGGSVRYAGGSLVGADPAGIVRGGITLVPEGRRIFGHLTVEENLRAGGVTRSRRDRRAARDRIYEMFPVLAERRGQRAGLLSGGEQQMLAIGRGLMTGPSLLLLDEPSLGLAPKVVDQVAEVVGRIRADGPSVVLVEQNAAVALSLADHAYVLDLGTVGLSGPADELAASDDIRRLYLGSAADPIEAPEGPTLRRWAS